MSQIEFPTFNRNKHYNFAPDEKEVGLQGMGGASNSIRVKANFVPRIANLGNEIESRLSRERVNKAA